MKGTGYERRFILIKAENKISREKRDGTLQTDIKNGKYNKGLAKWIYKSINIYYKNRKNLFSKKTEKTMLEEWKWKSNPLKIAINTLFRPLYICIEEY